MPGPYPRRGFLGAALGAAALGLARRAEAADEVVVPLRLQAELLAKVASYDRNFAARAGERALVLLVARGGDATSERVAEGMAAELASVATVGGKPHRERVVPFETAAHLSALVKSERAAIVYLAPRLFDDVPAIADALTGQSILSAAAVPDYVERRAVLGFDVQGGKPKLVIHITQARRQQVDFKAGLLKLARVIE